MCFSVKVWMHLIFFARSIYIIRVVLSEFSWKRFNVGKSYSLLTVFAKQSWRTKLKLSRKTLIWVALVWFLLSIASQTHRITSHHKLSSILNKRPVRITVLWTNFNRNIHQMTLRMPKYVKLIEHDEFLHLLYVFVLKNCAV